MNVSVAMFDLDGTLVDSLEDLTDAVNVVLSDFNRAPLSSAEVRLLVGKGQRSLVKRALGTESLEEIERGLGIFVEYNAAHITDKSRLYPGVLETLETLEALAAMRTRMVVISNKQECLSRLILERLRIDRFFEAICGGDTFSEMKPSPLPLIQVMERFGVQAAETVMIGDSINDFQAGKQAGVTTIGCSWGYGSSEELREADLLINSPNELVAILKGQTPAAHNPRKSPPTTDRSI